MSFSPGPYALCSDPAVGAVQRWGCVMEPLES
jgi:hypothetical protein